MPATLLRVRSATADRFRGWLVTASNLLLLVLVFVAVLSTAVLDRSAQVFVLKIFAVLFLSALPGLLYLQFVSGKGRSLYDEYVLNLYRLGIDSIGNLPKPPPGCGLYSAWQRESEEADPAHNIYLRKFQATYGHKTVPHARRVRADDGLRPRDHERATSPFGSSAAPFSPVLLVVVVYLVGWSAVLQPELYRDLHLINSVSLSGLPELPTDALRFGFAGAYAFTLQALIRRYYDADLKTGAYVSAVARVVYVILLVAIVGTLLPKNPALNVAAFVVGVFPDVGWQVIRKAAAVTLGSAVETLQPRYPLSRLDGVTVWTQARLLEEGIEDLENLTTANLVDLMLETRVPLNRLVDWVDQAYLELHLRTDQTLRALLAGCGIRTASDFLDAVRSDDDLLCTALRTALGTDAYRLEGLRRSLEGEINLRHIRQWRKGEWLDDGLVGAPNAVLAPLPADIEQGAAA